MNKDFLNKSEFFEHRLLLKMSESFGGKVSKKEQAMIAAQKQKLEEQRTKDAGDVVDFSEEEVRNLDTEQQVPEDIVDEKKVVDAGLKIENKLEGEWRDLPPQYRNKISDGLATLYRGREQRLVQINLDANTELVGFVSQVTKELGTFIESNKDLSEIVDILVPLMKKKSAIAKLCNLVSYRKDSGYWRKINAGFAKLGFKKADIVRLQKILGVEADGKVAHKMINAMAAKLGIGRGGVILSDTETKYRGESESEEQKEAKAKGVTVQEILGLNPEPVMEEKVEEPKPEPQEEADFTFGLEDLAGFDDTPEVPEIPEVEERPEPFAKDLDTLMKQLGFSEKEVRFYQAKFEDKKFDLQVAQVRIDEEVRSITKQLGLANEGDRKFFKALERTYLIAILKGNESGAAGVRASLEAYVQKHADRLFETSLMGLNQNKAALDKRFQELAVEEADLKGSLKVKEDHILRLVKKNLGIGEEVLLALTDIEGNDEVIDAELAELNDLSTRHFAAWEKLDFTRQELRKVAMEKEFAKYRAMAGLGLSQAFLDRTLIAIDTAFSAEIKDSFDRANDVYMETRNEDLQRAIEERQQKIDEARMRMMARAENGEIDGFEADYYTGKHTEALRGAVETYSRNAAALDFYQQFEGREHLAKIQETDFPDKDALLAYGRLRKAGIDYLDFEQVSHLVEKGMDVSPDKIEKAFANGGMDGLEYTARLNEFSDEQKLYTKEALAALEPEERHARAQQRLRGMLYKAHEYRKVLFANFYGKVASDNANFAEALRILDRIEGDGVSKLVTSVGTEAEVLSKTQADLQKVGGLLFSLEADFRRTSGHETLKVSPPRRIADLAREHGYIPVLIKNAGDTGSVEAKAQENNGRKNAHWLLAKRDANGNVIFISPVALGLKMGEDDPGAKPKAGPEDDWTDWAMKAYDNPISILKDTSEKPKVNPHIKHVNEWNEQAAILRLLSGRDVRGETGEFYAQNREEELAMLRGEINSEEIPAMQEETEQAKSNLMVALQTNPNLRRLRQEAVPVAKDVGKIQGMLKAVADGAKTQDFVRHIKSEAGALIRFGRLDAMKASTKAAKEDLAALKLFASGTEDDAFEKYLNDTIRQLSQVEATCGQVVKFVQTINGIKDDSFETWAKTDGVKMAAAVLSAILVATGVGAVVGGAMAGASGLVFSATSFALQSGAASLGAMIGSELAAEALGEKTALDIYREEIENDPSKQREAFSKMIMAYGSQFALSTAQMMLFSGLGKMCGRGLVVAAESNIVLLANLARHIGKVSSNMQLNFMNPTTAGGKLVHEALQEFLQEFMQSGMQQIDPVLGFLGNLLSSMGKLDLPSTVKVEVVGKTEMLDANGKPRIAYDAVYDVADMEALAKETKAKSGEGSVNVSPDGVVTVVEQVQLEGTSKTISRTVVYRPRAQHDHGLDTSGSVLENPSFEALARAIKNPAVEARVDGTLVQAVRDLNQLKRAFSLDAWKAFLKAWGEVPPATKGRFAKVTAFVRDVIKKTSKELKKDGEDGVTLDQVLEDMQPAPEAPLPEVHPLVDDIAERGLRQRAGHYFGLLQDSNLVLSPEEATGARMLLAELYLNGYKELEGMLRQKMDAMAAQGRDGDLVEAIQEKPLRDVAEHYMHLLWESDAGLTELEADHVRNLVGDLRVAGYRQLASVMEARLAQIPMMTENVDAFAYQERDLNADYKSQLLQPYNIEHGTVFDGVRMNGVEDSWRVNLQLGDRNQIALVGVETGKIVYKSLPDLLSAFDQRDQAGYRARQQQEMAERSVREAEQRARDAELAEIRAQEAAEAEAQRIAEMNESLNRGGLSPETQAFQDAYVQRSREQDAAQARELASNFARDIEEIADPELKAEVTSLVTILWNTTAIMDLNELGRMKRQVDNVAAELRKSGKQALADRILRRFETLYAESRGELQAAGLLVEEGKLESDEFNVDDTDPMDTDIIDRQTGRSLRDDERPPVMQATVTPEMVLQDRVFMAEVEGRFIETERVFDALIDEFGRIDSYGVDAYRTPSQLQLLYTKFLRAVSELKKFQDIYPRDEMFVSLDSKVQAVQRIMERAQGAEMSFAQLEYAYETLPELTRETSREDAIELVRRARYLRQRLEEFTDRGYVIEGGYSSDAAMVLDGYIQRGRNLLDQQGVEQDRGVERDESQYAGLSQDVIDSEPEGNYETEAKMDRIKSLREEIDNMRFHLLGARSPVIRERVGRQIARLEQERERLKLEYGREVEQQQVLLGRLLRKVEGYLMRSYRGRLRGRDVTVEEVLGFFDKEINDPNLTRHQRLMLKARLRVLVERAQKVNEIYQKYKRRPKVLYKLLFNREAVGNVQLHYMPPSIMFKLEQEDLYSFDSRGGFKGSSLRYDTYPGELAPLSGMVNLGIQFGATALHENRHTINSIVMPEMAVGNLSTNLSDLARMKDEVIASFDGNDTSPEVIEKMLIDDPIYAIQRQIIAHPDASADDKAVAKAELESHKENVKMLVAVAKRMGRRNLRFLAVVPARQWSRIAVMSDAEVADLKQRLAVNRTRWDQVREALWILRQDMNPRRWKATKKAMAVLERAFKNYGWLLAPFRNRFAFLQPYFEGAADGVNEPVGNLNFATPMQSSPYGPMQVDPSRSRLDYADVESQVDTLLDQVVNSLRTSDLEHFDHAIEQVKEMRQRLVEMSQVDARFADLLSELDQEIRSFESKGATLRGLVESGRFARVQPDTAPQISPETDEVAVQDYVATAKDRYQKLSEEILEDPNREKSEEDVDKLKALYAELVAKRDAGHQGLDDLIVTIDRDIFWMRREIEDRQLAAARESSGGAKLVNAKQEVFALLKRAEGIGGEKSIKYNDFIAKAEAIRDDLAALEAEGVPGARSLMNTIDNEVSYLTSVREEKRKNFEKNNQALNKIDESTFLSLPLQPALLFHKSLNEMRYEYRKLARWSFDTREQEHRIAELMLKLNQHIDELREPKMAELKEKEKEIMAPLIGRFYDAKSDVEKLTIIDNAVKELDDLAQEYDQIDDYVSARGARARMTELNFRRQRIEENLGLDPGVRVPPLQRPYRRPVDQFPTVGGISLNAPEPSHSADTVGGGAMGPSVDINVDDLAEPQPARVETETESDLDTDEDYSFDSVEIVDEGDLDGLDKLNADLEVVHDDMATNMNLRDSLKLLGYLNLLREDASALSSKGFDTTAQEHRLISLIGQLNNRIDNLRAPLLKELKNQENRIMKRMRFKYNDLSTPAEKIDLIDKTLKALKKLDSRYFQLQADPSRRYVRGLMVELDLMRQRLLDEPQSSGPDTGAVVAVPNTGPVSRQRMAVESSALVVETKQKIREITKPLHRAYVTIDDLKKVRRDLDAEFDKIVDVLTRKKGRNEDFSVEEAAVKVIREERAEFVNKIRDGLFGEDAKRRENEIMGW